jgi:hypothetical protein
MMVFGPNQTRHSHGIATEETSAATLPMALVSVHRLTITPVIAHPTSVFFNTEARTDATALVGSYEYGVDFEIYLLPSSLRSNNFVYKFKSTQSTFRVFLFGRISSIEKFAAQQEEVGRGPFFIFLFLFLYILLCRLQDFH